jgi:DNA-directed RNA polymerase subunit RPC12/RpoP
MRVCSECGTAMTVAEQIESGTPPYIRVKESLTCPNCGLNIRRIVLKKVDAPKEDVA